MVYEYMTFPDGTEIVHTQILNENTNPTVEVNFERPTSNATKVLLTSTGGCIVENNKSQIPQNKLNDLLEAIQAQFFYICQRWMKAFATEKIDFYC